MEKPKLVYESYIRTTPEKLWAAITKPEFTRQYWGDMINVSDWRVGSKWEHLPDKKDETAWVEGKVVELVPAKRLVLTWFDPDEPADVSRVTFEIESVADLVRLQVIHDGFKDGSAMAGKVSKGWPLVLSSLKSFLETGKGLDIWCGKQLHSPDTEKKS